MLLLLFVSALEPAAAQVMPGPQRVDWETEHSRYSVEAFQGVRQLMTDWQSAVAGNDAAALARFYTDNALVHLWDGLPFQGRAAIEDGLQELLPGIERMEMVASDFAASGLLFYSIGRFWGRLAAGEASAITGTYVLIAEREHRRWRIRSHVFKADPPQS